MSASRVVFSDLDAAVDAFTLNLLDDVSYSFMWPCAVGTVLLRDDDVLGYNTDYKAAMDCLENALGGVVPPGTPSPLEDKRVLVLGAGGVARAVMYGLQRRGAKATIASRTRSRAQYLADTFGGCLSSP